MKLKIHKLEVRVGRRWSNGCRILFGIWTPHRSVVLSQLDETWLDGRYTRPTLMLSKSWDGVWWGPWHLFRAEVPFISSDPDPFRPDGPIERRRAERDVQ